MIVVQNLRPEEYEGLYPNVSALPDNPWLKDIGVSAEQVLLTKTPTEWEEQMLRLYGGKIEAASATLTVFFSETSEHKDDHSQQLRYFAHAIAPDEQEPSTEYLSDFGDTTQSAELTSPGQNYDDAFQLLRAAAYNRLDIERDIASEEGIAALAYVEKLGFQVLTLSGFLRSFARIFDIDDSSSG